MDKIVVIGASGHAKVIIEIVETSKDYQIYGLIDTYKEKGQRILNYEIVGTEHDIPDLVNKGVNKGIIAIGDNWNRLLIQKKIKKISPNFQFITVIHPTAIVSPSVKIGQGTVILASVVVNAEAEIGDFCILNTGASFGHDSSVKNFSSIAPGVTVGGNVSIDICTAISLGANIIQGITIGKHSIVGAGSLVLNSIGDYKLVYGVPAKEIRNVQKGENYLSKS
ncbi:acetyltransferase [Aquimarina muelleri]|uniref:acetyltransferase n=1 Tax=Aquimarina muelleri TaxID=279356 RepID=UPI003F682985